MRKLKNEELDRLSVEEFKDIRKNPIQIILDNVRSANNVGSVFRTSDAFLIDHIYLCGITAQPPNKDIHKTALGSTETVNWSYHSNTLDLIHGLNEQGIITVAIEQAVRATPLNSWRPESNKKFAFVFGNEVQGVSQEVVSACQHVIEIPQYGSKHSLNLANSASIVIWEAMRQLNCHS